MKLKVGRVREAFSAVCALKGSFSRMGAFVLPTRNPRKEKIEHIQYKHPKTKVVCRRTAEDVLTCLRLDVCEKDLEQTEQT